MIVCPHWLLAGANGRTVALLMERTVVGGDIFLFPANGQLCCLTGPGQTTAGCLATMGGQGEAVIAAAGWELARTVQSAWCPTAQRMASPWISRRPYRPQVGHSRPRGTPYFSGGRESGITHSCRWVVARGWGTGQRVLGVGSAVRCTVSVVACTVERGQVRCVLAW